MTLAQRDDEDTRVVDASMLHLLDVLFAGTFILMALGEQFLELPGVVVAFGSARYILRRGR